MKLIDDVIKIISDMLNINELIIFGLVSKQFYNIVKNNVIQMKQICCDEKINRFNLMVDMASRNPDFLLSVTTMNEMKCSIIPNKIHFLKIDYHIKTKKLIKYEDDKIIS